jgi:hypothetical protein
MFQMINQLTSTLYTRRAASPHTSQFIGSTTVGAGGMEKSPVVVVVVVGAV